MQRKEKNFVKGEVIKLRI